MSEKSTYRERLCAWLRDQGHEATVERHDDLFATVAFRERGSAFIVRTDESDPSFLFITHRHALPDAVKDRAKAHRLAHHIERGLKVVKVALDWNDRNVEFNAEQFVADGEFAPIFWRCVSVLEEASNRFFEELRNISSAAAAERFIDDMGRDLGFTP